MQHLAGQLPATETHEVENMILTHSGITPPDLGSWCYAEAAETTS